MPKTRSTAPPWWRGVKRVEYPDRGRSERPHKKRGVRGVIPFRAAGTSRDGGGALSGGQKKERGQALSGLPSFRCDGLRPHLVGASIWYHNFWLLSSPFFVVFSFGCCTFPACRYLASEVRSRPRAGGGWALLLAVAAAFRLAAKKPLDKTRRGWYIGVVGSISLNQ